MDVTGKELENYKQKKADLTIELEQIIGEMEAVQERIDQRREFIEARIRTMYMEGQISYLDVLLSANSISDFLDRMDTLTMVVKQDQKMVDQYRLNQTQVEQQKVEIDNKLIQAKSLIYQTEQLKSNLIKQENEKSVLISSLNKKSEAISDISEEQEMNLIRLANKQANLLRQKEEASRTKKVIGSGGNIAWPFDKKYPVTSDFGYRTHPITGEKESFHKGLDIGAPGGTAILAAGSGTVIVAQSMAMLSLLIMGVVYGLCMLIFE
ncbi:murein hydrolase activator EnvC family protein [Cohnella phaseoli]|uniref:Peptidoglycan hydrolase PcsB coiled-coil domain-containing protein n=1 Tax=Cohnella phaseoli TaxID=456490 RepID=A0A3D9JPW0_9BACL|nr:hypothetical protein [Cohnella phaseoli]RED76064.1 hypothetical protein DFP98_113124 [Cohnella phaseoli]